MSDELIAISQSRIVGRVVQPSAGKIVFSYDEDWRAAEDGYSISLSMPRAVRTHPDKTVRPFLDGLLPDNREILQQWGRRYGVSANNPFALLTHVGEDCAGAIQYVPANRLAELTASEPQNESVNWQTESEIANRLRELRSNTAAWRLSGDTGQFSLAGAHAKTALLFEEGRWGIPSGRTPTTHILKPPIQGYDGIIENEHVCLDLARTLGLPAAKSTVVRFEDQVAIAVERFDRRREAGRWLRVHQEDCCQALSISPEIKYQNQGGPGAEEIIRLLRDYSTTPTEDVWTFVRALIFNWLIAGTDAHAKNYGVLIGAGTAVRLAPLYDIASALPYPIALPRQKIKLAMKIGGEYLVSRIARPDWEELAKRNGPDPAHVIAEAIALAEAFPEAIEEVMARAAAVALDADILPVFKEAALVRARDCIAFLNTTT